MELINPYGLVLLNPDRFPHINVEAAQKFADWLISEAGQSPIGVFEMEGAQLFCPNAAEEQYSEDLNCPAQGL